MGGCGDDSGPWNYPKVTIRRFTRAATDRSRQLGPGDPRWDVSPPSASSRFESRSIALTVDRFPQDSSGLFHNYADNSSTFLDASSTALLASTVYRLSLLWGVHTHIPQAEFARQSLSTPGSTSGLLRFTENGWLTPVVDPYGYPDQGQDSPEGQAFVISMQAAWRDWVADGAQGANGSPRSTDLNVYVLLAPLVVFNFVFWSGV